MTEAQSTEVTVVATDMSVQEDGWDENDENYDNEGSERNDEEEDDDDADAEAEEIARRLRDQLWADINAARANANASAVIPTVPAVVPPPEIVQTQPRSKKEEAALFTMRAILTFADKYDLVRTSLTSAIVPDSNGDNVLDLLARCAASGTIPKSVAKPLSHLLVSLARSDALFSSLRHSNAPAIQLDKGKRKRDVVDEQDDARVHKRPFYTHHDMQAQVTEAVRVVTQALSAAGATTHPLEPALVKSIQLQLHQIFLFAVTSSARGGTDMNALQEICGLIQVIGVLSGIQIGPTPDAISQPAQQPSGQPSNANRATSAPAIPPVQAGDIGTAVYPCPTCRKIFSRLYSLRAHLRIHGPERPFHCTSCPATFARSYDLKRHTKLHDKTAWRCSGCDKMFSRRDAIKRHKNTALNRGILGEACVNGEVEEVEQNRGEEKSLKDNRQVRIWGDTVANQTSGVMEYSSSSEEGPLEEGEVRTDVIARLQSIVMSLHGLLSAHVTATLGTPSGSDSSPIPDNPTDGQATLASVIARAQLRNLPTRPQEPEVSPPTASQSHIDVVPNPGSTSSINQLQTQDPSQPSAAVSATPSLTLYGLSDDQAKMLEQAIANAASAAQAQAEAEAALEEEDEGYDDDEVDGEVEGGDQDA